MKYLFINSVAGFGSTGRIAAQTCRELMGQGHECVLAFGRKEDLCPDVPTVRIGSGWDSRLHGLRSRLLDDHGFGSRAATEKFLQWVGEYDPDVIWLHNIHGYYIHIGLLFDYLRTCGKEIRWTLHDCWSFTGHCPHYEYVRCDKWKTGCRRCPQRNRYPKSILLDRSRRNYDRKKALFTGIPNLTLVVPCHWLEDQLRESFLRDYPVEVVYNTVNTEIFRPTPGSFRRDHGLEDKKIALGVASVWDERKGLKDIEALGLMLPDRWKVVIVGLTPAQIRDLPPGVMGLPRTGSPRELAEIYTAADVFVNTTYEDTYPTVNLEARACGARVVSYDTGGCRETLGPEDFLVPRGKLEQIQRILKREWGF